MKTLTEQTQALATSLLQDVNTAYQEGEAPFFHSLERFEKGARGLEAMANYMEIARFSEEGGAK